MFANFLPSLVEQLSEPSSVALAQSIQVRAIATPLADESINTTYVNQGTGGTPILLLHGFDSSVLEFRQLIPLLTAENEIWAVDMLGFGFTNRLSGITYNSTAIKTHLYYFWKTMIHQPIILVGASMGGAAAIDFTLTFPEIVQKLILINSAGLKAISPVGKLFFPLLDNLAAEFLRNPQVRQQVSRSAYQDPKFVSEDALICGSLHLQMPNWHSSVISFTKSGGYKPFRREQLAQIKQSTMILWGDSDRILGTKDAEKLAKLIPQSQLIWIPDCGHIPHREKSQIVAQQILTFGNKP
jgi:pimeloyl-ACP methyl ester carboxylesterase